MRKSFAPLLVTVALVIFIATGLLMWGSSKRPAVTDAKHVVAASIYPLYDIARNVAGSEVSVELVLPPGASPHTFEPRPSDALKLEGVPVVYEIGHGLDSWVRPMLQSGKTEEVVVDRGITIRAAPEGSDEEGDDPHYWLDMRNAERIAQNVADDLTARFPDHAEAFAANLAAYLETLNAADRQMRDIIAGAPNKKIVTMHDAWYYFADAYGLTVVGSFEPTAGREPTPQYLVALKEAVEAANTRTLFTEPLISTAGIQSFVEDNHLRVAVLDPVEGAVGQDHHYVDSMLQNARTIRDSQ